MYKKYKRILEKVRLFLYRKASHVVFQTEEARNYFAGLSNTTIIKNPLEVNLPIKESYDDEKFFVAVGRLETQKNYKVMLDAMNIVCDKFPEAELNIYGKGKLENELKTYSDLWKIIHTGSYPEMYNSQRDWQEYYSSYVSTYLERDINELISTDSITFTKFLTSVAARTGEILNYANIASEVGISEPTIKNWISILERTGIVYLLQPYSASVLSRAIKSPKIYFRDTGLACYLTRWLTPDALKNSAVAGNMFETFVVAEILKSYINEGKDYRFNIFYYRGKDKNVKSENEIDLILEENGILYPIEIKMTGNPKSSMGATNQILDKIPEKSRGMGVILCLTDKKLYLRENLLALPIEYL